MNAIKNSFQARLQLSFLAIIIMSAIGGLISYSLLTRIVEYQQVTNQVKQLVALTNNARMWEKEFLLYGKKNGDFYEGRESRELKAHQGAVEEMNSIIVQLSENPLFTAVDTENKLEVISNAFVLYTKDFDVLVSLLKDRGFKDWGLEGAMRSDIHDLERVDSNDLKYFVLMLRRHEKDFFLRQDLKYVDKLHKRSIEYKDYVLAQPLAAGVDAATQLAAIDRYVNRFKQIAALDEKIGLGPELGIQGQLSHQIALVEDQVNALEHNISKASILAVNRGIVVLIASLLISLLVAIFVSFYLARRIGGPLRILTAVTRQVRKGNSLAVAGLSKIRRSDEIGILTNDYREMLNELNEKVSQIEIKNLELEETARQDEIRTWMASGLNRFERLFIDNQSNIQNLGDKFLHEAVHSLDGAMAGLYLECNTEDGTQAMQLVSAYAYDRKKIIAAEFKKGESLVGSVWQEGSAVFIDEIPEDYAKVKSGLGGAAPRSLMVLPIKDNDGIVGILEFASFKPLSENHKELLLKACKGLSSVVKNSRMQVKTQQLLDEAQLMAAQLRENEEEMRQQIEELTATQEELRRKQDRAIVD